MKTAGRITATLVTLLALYVLGYWLLIKQGWAYQLLSNGTDPFQPTKALTAVRSAFAPIRELEQIWTVDVPLRKHLTGHWRSARTNDFVTLGPNQEFHFQLG